MRTLTITNIPLYYAVAPKGDAPGVLTEKVAQVAVSVFADYPDGSRRTMKRTVVL